LKVALPTALQSTRKFGTVEFEFETEFEIWLPGALCFPLPYPNSSLCAGPASAVKYPRVKRLLVLFFGVALLTPGLGQQPKINPSAREKSQNSALDRATAAFNAGKYQEAEKLLDAAQRENPKQPAILNLRGAILTKQKAYDQAEEQYNAALALDPKYYPAMLNLAEMDLLRGKYPESQERYRELQKIDPDSELIEFKLVLCAVLAGESARADSLVVRMKFPGKTPAYYYARAAIALKAGQKQNAQTYFSNVKKYYSDDECAYFDQSLKDLGLTLQNAPSPTPIPTPTPT
jgi:tetratricopeptide (TPR) repeat protein